MIYAFVLALILWSLVLPLRPARWSYRNVLTFVTLTAPPALLYAIPVERFLSRGAAQDANVVFLAVVATWRVLLLATFLRRAAQLSTTAVVVATGLPLTLIVCALAALNLEHVVFDIMSGNADRQGPANESAYLTVVIISGFSVLAAPILLAVYVGLIREAWRRRATS